MDIYSGFGEIKESKKPSAPKYSFGTSTRDAEPKKFHSKEMAQIDCYGITFFTQANKLPKDLIIFPLTNFYITNHLNIS